MSRYLISYKKCPVFYSDFIINPFSQKTQTNKNQKNKVSLKAESDKSDFSAQTFDMFSSQTQIS